MPNHHHVHVDYVCDACDGGVCYHGRYTNNYVRNHNCYLGSRSYRLAGIVELHRSVLPAPHKLAVVHKQGQGQKGLNEIHQHLPRLR